MVLSSVDSNEYHTKVRYNQSRDSDRTTHKEIYIKNDSSEYPNLEDIDPSIFTPPGKTDTIRNGYLRKRYEMMYDTEETKEKEAKKLSIKNPYSQENDNTSSPEPLSSKLENQKMKVYQIEHMEELDIEKIKDAGEQFREQLENEHSTLAVKSHIMYSELSYLNYDRQPVSQVSGDKQTPSERQTVAGDDQDTPQIEFVPFEEDDVKSVTEFD